MALRNLVIDGDPLLRKTSRPVEEITPRIIKLLDDMADTMYYGGRGIGIAAPQVGVLKRIFVIDVSPEGDSPMVFINPEILETSGEQTGYEGCLSVPGKSGIVTRPNYVKAKATNLDGEEFVVEGEELFARAILHENDHLDGHMYVEKVEGELINNEDLIAQNEEAQE